MNGTIHRFRALRALVLATGGYGRLHYYTATSAHTCTGDGGGHGARVRACPCQDMEFVQFQPHWHLRRGALLIIPKARAGRAATSPTPKASGSLERYAPSAKDLASRDVVSRSMALEMREGRGVGPEGDHIYLHLDHIDPAVLAQRLPGITESGKNLRGRRSHPSAAPRHPDGALQHGRHSV